ncbi:AMP-binding protein [Roseivivax sp. CAU 1753]
MDSLPAAFARAAARWSDRTALIEGDGTPITFAALQARVIALTEAWRARGLGPGDRALVAMPVGADLYASLAAIWSLGATAVLPEPALGLGGLHHALRAVPVQAFCAAGVYRLLHLALPGLWRARHLTPVAAGGGRTGAQGGFASSCQPGDIALISFTSGTTGAPKAIPRSHRFLMAQRAAVAPLLASDDNTVDLVGFPVFVLLNLAAGRTSVLPDWPLRRADRVTTAGLHRLIARHGVTRALLPPALCETLAEKPLPPGLHTVFTGGGPVFPDMVRKLTDAAPDLRVVSVYGSTEAEPIAEIEASAIAPPDRASMAAGAGLLAYRPARGVSLRIENGEIWVAGDHVVQGYLDPARDAENKRRIDGVIWHRTGDAGRLDDAGRLWLLGRHGAAVETPRGTLYPFCIETAARMWPGVRRAALAQVDATPVLAIEGDESHSADWQRRASEQGIDRVIRVARMPMDRRHRSKVDQARLARLL